MMEFLFDKCCHSPAGKLEQGWHDGISSLSGQFYISEDAWYDCNVKGHYINKVVGFTLDTRITINSSGWWNHRNSIRLGWKPASTQGYADTFLYLHFNGRPFLPTPQRQLFVNTVKLGVANEFLLMANGLGVSKYPFAAVNGVQSSQSVMIANSIIFPAPKAGLVLAPYHGGDPKPYNPYIIGLQLNDY